MMRPHRSRSTPKVYAKDAEENRVFSKGIVAMVTISTAVACYRLYRLCKKRVPPGQLAVVYDSRRLSVFSHNDVPQLSGEKRATEKPNFTTLIKDSLFPVGQTFVTVPPLPFFKIFSLPQPVITSNIGNEVSIAVEDIPTTDGKMKAQLRLKYFIDANEINRYLTVVGPTMPNRAIGVAISAVLKSHMSDQTARTMTNVNQRNSVFLPAFRNSVIAKLYELCCIRMIEVYVEKVDFMDEE